MAVLIGLVLLALVSYDLQKGVKMPRLLVYLGAASYSIYLVHSTVIDLGLVSLRKIAPVLLVNHLGVTMAVLALISVGCGLICHELLEKPLIRWFRSLRAEKV
jgi:peptidoglycan/LPS O-acetylase OafA/YrhL